MSDCDKVLLACKRHDHPLQRKYTFMKKQNLNPFDLNRTEYAELLGITPNAVRMRMRHGRLEGQYKFENGKYFFKTPIDRDWETRFVCESLNFITAVI